MKDCPDCEMRRMTAGSDAARWKELRAEVDRLTKERDEAQKHAAANHNDVTCRLCHPMMVERDAAVLALATARSGDERAKALEGWLREALAALGDSWPGISARIRAEAALPSTDVKVKP